MSHHSLPDEVWERIFAFLSPIGPDLLSSTLVSRRFRNIVYSLKARQRIHFTKALKSIRLSSEVAVSRVDARVPNEIRPSRVNFSSAFLRGALYIFGGFTDNQTSLNDLWRFCVSRAQWERVLATTVPSAAGGAAMVPDHVRNRLILFGGRFMNTSTNTTPRSHALPNIYRNELHVINLSTNPTNWIPLALPDRPSGRANAAACLMPELDMLLLDGGVTERRAEAEQSTFILDTKLHSTTSWRWISDTKIGGEELPVDRVQHQLVCISATSFVMIGAGQAPPSEQFLRGDVSVGQFRRHPELDIPPLRKFEIVFTRLRCPVPKSMPNYLQGSKVNFEPSLNLLYWLSPVPKSEKKMTESSLGLFRQRLDPERNELHPVGTSPSLKLSSGGAVPCLLGHTFGPSMPAGLLLYGGALCRSSQSSSVWEGLHRIQEVPSSSNDLYFLQMF